VGRAPVQGYRRGRMYNVEDSVAVLRAHRRLLSRAGAPGVRRTVVLLGITSLLTDISSEMFSTILPLYLMTVLGTTPLQFGIIDGLYQGAAALVQVASGVAGDRWRRHKEIAATGYGLSAICKLLLLAVGSAWAAIAAVVLLERTGKGIRTAPRDAMISMAVPKEELGAAFGVHRALDTTGAMLGPLVAFAILAAIPLGFDQVFVASFGFAVIGLAVLLAFVPREHGRPRRAGEPKPGLGDVAGLVRIPGFGALLSAGGILGLVTMSDAFIYLGLQRQLDLPITAFPLLFLGMSSVYMLLAMPAGRLADRIGRTKVFLAGYVLLLGAYLALLSPLGGVALVVVVLLCHGSFYAATDGVLAAIGSARLPEETRASGLALLNTATGLTKFAASLAFGALWTFAGLQTAIVCFAAGLVVAMACAAVVLNRRPAHA
jgi:MFS family permease